MTDEDRFLAKTTSRPNGCVEWTSAMDRHGYGQFWLNGSSVLAHRVAIEFAHHCCILPGYEVDHLCMNRCCVNPEHLEVVTPHENTRRSIESGRHNGGKDICPQGHPYDSVNTYRWRNQRHCRTCNALAVARYKEHQR